MSTSALTPAGTPGAAEALRDATTGARQVGDLAGELLERIAEVDGQIGAFRIVDEAGVRERAKSLEGHPSGALYGVGVGVKDVIDTADLPTGYGSPLFADHQPSRDAAVVARLRAAGAVVIGKTESTEFALFHPTRTRNPVDTERTPGGSSSGSAAAVAAGMVPVALGTQTAGSTLRPAAYCGVYGLKPTRGWTSTEGVWLLGEHLDTIGLFARSVADLSLLYRALRTAPGADPAPRPERAARRRVVGVLDASAWASSDGDVADALDAFSGHLEDAGWEVREVAMPTAWARLAEQHLTVMVVEVAKNLRAALGQRVELISPSARELVERGDACPAADYLAALAAVEDALAVATPMAEAVDVLLAPTAQGVAPLGLDATGDPVMCRPWTLLGLPAANVPGYRRRDGLPVGVQALGLRAHDLEFLDDLASIEAAVKGAT